MLTTLVEKDFEARGIMATTGHNLNQAFIRIHRSVHLRKIVRSVMHCLQTYTTNQKNKQKKWPKKPTSTISLPDQKINSDIIPESPQSLEIIPGFDDEDYLNDKDIMTILM